MFYWIGTFGYLALFGIFLLESVYLVLFGLIAHKAFKEFRGLNIFLIPSIWLLNELFRLYGPFAFDWSSLGYSQVNNIYLIQVTNLIGVYGLSFIIAFVNYLVFFFFKEKAYKKNSMHSVGYVFLIGLIFIVLFFYGDLSLKTKISGKEIKVGLVQGNIPQIEKFDSQRITSIKKIYFNGTTEAVLKGAEVVVWPETAYPLTVSDYKELDDVKELSEKIGATIFFGAFFQEREAVYNSIISIDNKGKIQRYDKVHLVPFGEYVPLRIIFEKHPLLSNLIDLTPASKIQLHDYKGYKVGTGICYETSDSELVRKMSGLGSSLLVFSTNDSYFDGTHALKHHLHTAILRAVENRKYVAQCANSGITAIISPQGRIINQLEAGKKGVLVEKINLLDANTPFNRIGYIIPYFLAVLGLLLFVTKIIRKKY